MHPDITTSSAQTGTMDWSSASDEEILNSDLLIVLGLETLSDEDKAELVSQMTSTVQKATVLRVLDNLSEEKKSELDSLLNSDDADKINAFLETEVPNFADLINEETVKFKRAMLTEATQG